MPEIRLKAPRAVHWIVRTLEEAGYETWAVGGAVRDALLGGSGGDWDLATRAKPDEVRRVFRRTVPIGIDHGTVGVLTREGTLYEVTTFRRDVETFGRHARVEYADEIETDLGRRDFTINAIAWHPIRAELRDPFQGLTDLEEGVLRTVGTPEDRFREDYLRVLRALRFSGQFELQIAPGTWTALSGCVGRLVELSAERIREELEKVLTGSRRPSAALALYAASGALATLYPELDALIGGGRSEGGTGDPWTRGIMVADALPRHRHLLRLAAILADVGRPPEGEVSPPQGSDPGRSPHSWERGALRTAAIMERLRFSNAQIREVGGLVEAIGKPRPSPENPKDVRCWLASVGPERFPNLIRVLVARERIDSSWRDDRFQAQTVALWKAAREQLRESVPLEVGDLALDGGDLIAMGLRPGPHFGEILDRLLEWVLDDPTRNRPEELTARVRQWLEEGAYGSADPGEHRG